MSKHLPRNPVVVSELLAKLSSDVAGARSEGELLTLAARRTAKLTNSERSSFALLDRREVQFQVYAMAKGQGRALPVGSAMDLDGTNVGIAVSERRLSRVGTDSGLRDIAHLARDGIVETMAVPLVVDDKVLGTLNIGTNDPDKWPAEIERLLEHWARTLSFGLGLRRSATRANRLLERAEGLVDGLRTLSHFGYALQGANHDEDAFRLADEFVREILPQTYRTSFGLVEPDSDSIRLVALNGSKLDQAKHIPLAGTAMEEVILQRRVLITDDLGHGPHASPMLVRAGVLSGVTAPIIAGERVLGVLNAGASVVAAFDDRASELLANAASLLGARLVNLQLNQERTQAAHNLARLLDGLPDAVCVVKDDIIRYVNRSFGKQLGYPGEEAVGLPIEAIGDLRELLAQQGDDLAPTDHVISRRDGTSVLATVSRIQVVYDGVETAALVIRDVSAQQEMERQLRLTERLASLGTMSAGIAHEINNPLAFLVGNLNVLEEQITQPADDFDWDMFGEVIHECKVGAGRIRRIVADLKMHSRAGESALVSVQLSEVIDSALRMVEHTIRHNATIDVAIDPLPPVMGEFSRLEQIFLNLLNNAAQAMPDRPRKHNTIRVRGFLGENGGVLIEVRDSGRGIPRNMIARVFDPFYTTKRVGEGTGLGLFITEGIVRNLGGTLTVESEVGVGTTFRLWLPKAGEAPLVPGRSSFAPPLRRPETGRILVIDDESAMCRTIQRIIGSEHDVHTTTSPKEGLALLEKDPSFDVLICDVMMPEMSGRRVYNAVQQSHPQLASRFIFVTGGAFTDEANTFLQETNSLVLQKPFGATELRDSVTQILGAAEA